MLERVANPHPGEAYVVRFAVPEFTSLCPITGQPDFAHLVIDYIPGDWIVESKSLKLYLSAFRNHGAFHEACTLDDRRAAGRGARAGVAAHRRLLVSARRHADRRVLADRRAARGRVASRPGRCALSWPGVSAIAEAIRAQARSALGFDAVGFAPAALAPGARRRARGFLAAGHHGDMGWLAERAPRRAATRRRCGRRRAASSARPVLRAGRGPAGRPWPAATAAIFRSMPATATTTTCSRAS